MLFSQPQKSRIEDRLDILTGVVSPSATEQLLKDNSVLSRPLDDAPNMLAKLFDKFANFDLLISINFLLRVIQSSTGSLALRFGSSV